MEMGAETSEGAVFPPTDWAGLGRVARDGTDLDLFIRRYWQPLKVYLLAAFPGIENQAESLLLDFAQDKMMKEGWLLRADQGRGRLRDFLKTSLRHFVLDQIKKSDKVRGVISLDQLAQEPVQEELSGDLFDLEWTRTVLEETLHRMQAACDSAKEDGGRKHVIWEMFRLRVVDPVFRDQESPPYKDLVARLGLKSPGEASNTLLSGKRLFKGILTEVIQEYAGQGMAAAAEIKDLENFLAHLARKG